MADKLHNEKHLKNESMLDEQLEDDQLEDEDQTDEQLNDDDQVTSSRKSSFSRLLSLQKELPKVKV